MSRKKKILLGLLVILLLIQFIRPAKNKAENAGVAFEKEFSVPAGVAGILKTSCYDCHSNHTNYPWYAEIQPVGWWLQSHVNDGKEELNFNSFGEYRLRRQFHKLEEIDEMLEEKEMPLSSYLVIHSEAKLSEAQSQTLSDWAKAMRDTMTARYPADSLKMKR